ncbi:MAG TPA: DNA (cytosine-5-)-methyltransferase [Slackia equolifaciens]|uniref:Cytosine-specific methyltransferase n=1 Tax=Slackia equolifaciens TaxID=498718 RepID=A0A9D2UX07_9ACTN|nr:DNA (cytosine-5-)-methyltransferase [Slackia equolifaciens]
MKTIRVAELFAGVGGFRLALDGYNDDARGWYLPPAGKYKTIWANQWEPPGTDSKQFAARCYKARFGENSVVNEDIERVLDNVEAGEYKIPEHDMVVGGFPCQDYSVARPLNQAGGIEGKKGVLWWQIYRFLFLCSPKYVLLENVDRLLKSPASQRGRDFAIMLACLSERGYSVEWRVVNAADYGAPQKRRRVYIYAEKDAPAWNLEERVCESGVMAKALPILPSASKANAFIIKGEPYEVSEHFGKGLKTSPFRGAGAMQNGEVFTAEVTPDYDGPFKTLGDVLVPETEVPRSFFIDENKLGRWKEYKDAKREERTHPSGYTYMYSEGGMAFPDPIDRPSRTILTSEGGAGASRTKHAVATADGRVRRLVPDELDQLQTFPKGWTDTGMTDGHRAFCMGNALVVEIVHRIGKEIARRAE